MKLYRLSLTIEFMLRPFLRMPIAFLMQKSRVWGNEIHIKITTCKEYGSHEMANVYYTSGSCSGKIGPFTFPSFEARLYNRNELNFTLASSFRVVKSLCALYNISVIKYDNYNR